MATRLPRLVALPSKPRASLRGSIPAETLPQAVRLRPIPTRNRPRILTNEVPQ